MADLEGDYIEKDKNRLKADPGTHEGFLQKRGDDLLKLWKSRFFIMAGATGSTLDYYECSEDKTKECSINTKFGSIIVIHSKITLYRQGTFLKRPYCFGITPPNSERTYLLQALSLPTREKWVEVLKSRGGLLEKELFGGYLLMGKEKGSGYSRRYFCLYKNRIEFWIKHTDEESVGSWRFGASTVCQFGSSQKAHSFSVLNTVLHGKRKIQDTKVLLLAAEDGKIKREWQKELTKLMEKRRWANRSASLDLGQLVVRHHDSMDSDDSDGGVDSEEEESVEEEGDEKKAEYDVWKDKVGALVPVTGGESVFSIQNATQIKCGFMHKKGILNSKWKKRYFVLTNDQLQYFKSVTDTECKGGILLTSESTLFREVSTTTKKNAFGVCPTKGGRKYLLYCATRSAKVEWMEAIASLITKQQKYKMLRLLRTQERLTQSTPTSPVSTKVTKIRKHRKSVSTDDRVRGLRFAASVRASPPTTQRSVSSKSTRIARSRTSPKLSIKRQLAVKRSGDPSASSVRFSSSVSTSLRNISLRASSTGHRGKNEYIDSSDEGSDSDGPLLVDAGTGGKMVIGHEQTVSRASLVFAIVPQEAASSLRFAKTIMKGWLYKRGEVNKNWKRRYVKLTNDDLCYYLNAKRNAKFKGKVVFGPETKLYSQTPEISREHAFGLLPVPGGRKYLFAAPSADVKNEWIEALAATVAESEIKVGSTTVTKTSRETSSSPQSSPRMSQIAEKGVARDSISPPKDPLPLPPNEMEMEMEQEMEMVESGVESSKPGGHLRRDFTVRNLVLPLPPTPPSLLPRVEF